MIDILMPAFLVSVVLLGLHSYFGIQIIRRGIIFTDLAVGQMAAFGAAIALLAFQGRGMFFTSLIFAIAAGMMIAWASRVTRDLEAVIGLIYAFGLSGVFLLLTKYPHGVEEFQNLMAYDILFTRMYDIGRVAVLYLALGIIIYLFNRRLKNFYKEILFFLTFAVTVTISVRMAGVLVVFAILLSPALIALVLGDKFSMPDYFRRFPLITAWIIGIIVNTTSIYISYRFDFPTGYTLVFFHSFLAIVFSFLFRQSMVDFSKKREMGNLK